MAEIMSPVTVMFGGAKKKKVTAKAPKAPTVAPMMPAYEPPSHEERLHNAAADEHVNATRDFVGGRISSAEFAKRKNRAAAIMAKTPKKTK